MEDTIYGWEEDCNTERYRETIAMIGSTRFMYTFIEKCWEFSKLGYVVTLPNFRPKTMMSKGFDIPEDLLEDIGFKRIDQADRVFVVNEDGYIGSSTRKEILYTLKNGKPIKFLEKISLDDSQNFLTEAFSDKEEVTKEVPDKFKDIQAESGDPVLSEFRIHNGDICCASEEFKCSMYRTDNYIGDHKPIYISISENDILLINSIVKNAKNSFTAQVIRLVQDEDNIYHVHPEDLDEDGNIVACVYLFGNSIFDIEKHLYPMDVVDDFVTLRIKETSSRYNK